MSDDDVRDLAAEIDELRERQEWAEESIRKLAEAVARLAETAAPNPMTRTARKMFTSRLDSALGRDPSQSTQE